MSALSQSDIEELKPLLQRYMPSNTKTDPLPPTRRGPRNSYMDSLTAEQRAIYWAGYHRGYSAGAERRNHLKQ